MERPLWLEYRMLLTLKTFSVCGTLCWIRAVCVTYKEMEIVPDNFGTLNFYSRIRGVQFSPVVSCFSAPSENRQINQCFL